VTNSILSLRIPEISFFKAYFPLKKNLRKEESAVENEKDILYILCLDYLLNFYNHRRLQSSSNMHTVYFLD